MNSLKSHNMLSAYDGHKGAYTVSAIKDFIPSELSERLTGRELGLVMSAINRAYHAGRAAQGAEIIDESPTNGAVWVDAINKAIYWRDRGQGLKVSLASD